MLALLIKITLITGLNLVILQFLKGNSPVLRHKIIFYCVALCLLLPLLNLSPLTFNLGISQEESKDQDGRIALFEQHAVLADNFHPILKKTAVSDINSDGSKTNKTPIADLVYSLALSIWIVGFIVKFLLYLSGLFKLRLLISKCEPYPRIEKIAAKNKQCVNCYISKETIVPFLYVGFKKRSIIMPYKVLRMNSQCIDTIISHELCHYQRKDHFSLWMVSLIEMLYWFHPLVVILGKKLRMEMELACDYQLIEQGIDSLNYAETLLKFPNADLHQSLIPAMSLSQNLLGKRIKLILSSQVKKVGFIKLQLLLTFFVLTIFTGCANKTTLFDSPLIELVSNDIPSLRAGELEKNNIVVAAFYDGKDEKNTYVELELSKKWDWSRTWVKLGPLEKFDKRIYTWHLKTVNGGTFTGKYKISGVVEDGMVDGIAVGIISSNDRGDIAVHKSNGPIETGMSNILCSWPLDLDNRKFQRLVPQLKFKGSESIKRLLCGSQLLLDGVYSVNL